LGEIQAHQRETQERIALALEKPLSIERNDREYWKYTRGAASEIVLDKTGSDRKPV
jgi:hypothetical protein